MMNPLNETFINIFKRDIDEKPVGLIEITSGICMNCDLKYSCIWRMNNKMYCEHYL